MNVSLAKKILKLTPKHILDPSPSIDSPLPLSTGGTIPALGLALHQEDPEPDQVKDAVLLAIKSGYRHFDTTSRNAAEVGRAIKLALGKGTVKREELFVTIRGQTATQPELEAVLVSQLKALGLGYADLFVTHFDKATTIADWKAIGQLPESDHAKAIGIADIDADSLEELLSTSKSIPTVVQLESNPYQPQNDVVQLCHDKIIHVTARSPFRSSTAGSLFNHEGVVKIADKHNVVPENVLLSWHLARGSSVLVEEVILGGSAENRKLVQLDADDMALLDEIAI